MNLDFRSFMARLREPETAPPWGATYALQIVLAYLLLRVLGLAFVTTLVDPAAITTGIVSPLTVNLALGLAALLATGLAWLAVARRTAEPVTRALRLDMPVRSTLLLLLFALGAAILIDFVALAFQTIDLPLNLIGLAGGDAAAWGAAALVTVLIVPLGEAILLQGLLYPALAARLGNNVRALAIVALIYAVLQVIDNPADLILWLQSYLAGVFLTGVRAHQQSTRAAFIAGIAFGLFALFKALRLFI